MHPMEVSVPSGQGRMSIYNRLMQSGLTTSLPTHRLNRKASDATVSDTRAQTPAPREPSSSDVNATPRHISICVPPPPRSPTLDRRSSSAAAPSSIQAGLRTPFMESVNHAVKNSGLQPSSLPNNLTTDDFTRAVAVATVSALQHHQAYPQSPGRVRSGAETHEDAGGHGGHDAPSWSRTTSASVLLACTALYAMIAGECHILLFP